MADCGRLRGADKRLPVLIQKLIILKVHGIHGVVGQAHDLEVADLR